MLAFFAVLSAVSPFAVAHAAIHPPLQVPKHFIGVDVNAIDLAVGWGVLHGDSYASFFSDAAVMGKALDAIALDLKRMGFSYVLLYSEKYPLFWGQQADIPYTTFKNSTATDGYVELFSKAAQKAGLMLIIAPPPAPEISQDLSAPNPTWNEVTLCEDSSFNKQFTDYIASLPSAAGYYCSFENYADLQRAIDAGTLSQADYSQIMTNIYSLRQYIESEGLLFVNTPGNTTPPPTYFPADSFTAYLMQTNPGNQYDATTMNSFLQGRSLAPAGISSSLWSNSLTGNQLSPIATRNGQKLGETPSAATVVDWLKTQYNPVLALGPQFWETGDWAELAIPYYPDSANDEYYYGSRSFVMSLGARLINQTLLVYDPLESLYGSEVVGGTSSQWPTYAGGEGCDTNDAKLGGGVAHFSGSSDIVYTDTVDPAPVLSAAQGTISFWVQPSWSQSDTFAHVFVASGACSASEAGFCLKRTPTDMLDFLIGDGTGTTYEVSRDISSWQEGEWHFVVATWDQSLHKLDLYIDGAQVAETNPPSAWDIPSPFNSVILGNDSGRRDSANADVDEFQVWQGVSTPANVLSSYQHFLNSAAGTKILACPDESVNPPPQTPTVSLDANGQNPATIYKSDTYSLNWSSANSSSCTLTYASPDGNDNESFTIIPNSSGSGTDAAGGTYALTCTGDSGQSATRSLVVSLQMPPVQNVAIDQQNASVASTFADSPSFVRPGDDTWVSWSGLDTTGSGANSWIALFKKGDPFTASSLDAAGDTWVYANSDCSKSGANAASASGSCKITLPSNLPAGTYIYELFGNGSYSDPLATGDAIGVGVPVITLDQQNPATNVGSGLSLFGTAANLSNVRIVIGTQTNATFANYASVTYDSGTIPVSDSGTWNVWVPTNTFTTPGSYGIDVTGAQGSGIGILSSAPLTVTTAPTLSTNSSSVATGGSVTLSWSDVHTGPDTWIGLFKKGDAFTYNNLAATGFTWAYLNCAKSIGSSPISGSCSFTIPSNLPSGTYIFELFGDSTYNDPVLGSGDITISASSAMAPSISQYASAIAALGSLIAQLQTRLAHGR